VVGGVARIVCVVGKHSISRGCAERLVFIGPNRRDSFALSDVPPQCLGPTAPILQQQDRRPTLERLTSGRYVPLPAPTLTLAPGETKAGDGLEAALERQVLRTRSVAHAGSWDVVRERFELICRGTKLVLLDATVEGAGESRAQLFAMGSGWVVATYRIAWGFEGETGDMFDAMVVSPECVVHRSSYRVEPR
jgi:hypothetical protein